jgi:hypothetical protein
MAHVRSACPGNGHLVSAHRGAVTMAERILREGDRLNPTGPALTISSCSASNICAICCDVTPATIIKYGHTSP